MLYKSGAQQALIEQIVQTTEDSKTCVYFKPQKTLVYMLGADWLAFVPV